MQKVDPRNKVGEIVCTISNRVLSNHTTKNIYGNVNYAMAFLQGTIMNAFDGRALGEKNAVQKLTVNFKMPAKDSALKVEFKRFAIH
jgi:hypothetical protein